MPLSTPTDASELEPLKSIYLDDQFFSPSFADYDPQPFPKWLEGIDTTFAPFLPTSIRRVHKALSLASLGPEDVLLDLGSGDGRFCVAAVREFDARRAVGVETEEWLVELSENLAKRAFNGEDEVKLERVRFVLGDFTTPELKDVVRDPETTCIVVFLSPEFSKEWEEFLVAHYEKGVKIVSMVFNLSELKALRCSVCEDLDGIFVYEKLKA
ncbi:S-adenosyl-L-methionine-dependent methyltransferase [Endogone sp. FLAS-F59071]|nr:S-adenosyl-L-methionine-dependent methyltransferase [Endogone sp. FLAS-F59071]|eukprot:RUS20262.1 S-adenosyl-L-methionine-dependent methyltransferase [Endogone sp. FLAS-F59071]